MVINRIARKTLETYLKNAGAVLITGPKYCGKTFLSRELARSEYFIIEKKTKASGSFLINKILDGESPRLIDEWQEYPEIWDHIKHRIDIAPIGKKKGLYILTGSTKSFDKDVHIHSGAGRIFTMNLSTLTFAEILNLSDEKSISLFELAGNKDIFKYLESPINIDIVNKYIMQGGWPELYDGSDANASILIQQYIESLVKRDIRNYKFNLESNVLLRILKSLARLDCTQIKYSTIYDDLQQEVSKESILKYLQLLYDLEILFDIEPWHNENLRSKYKIRTTPKTYFCDTSLVCQLLDIKNIDAFYDDLNTTGFIFENQVMKDLKVYAEVNGGQVYFLRDKDGHEVDAIVEFQDGTWWAVEIKLSEEKVLEAADNLHEMDKYFTVVGKHPHPTLKLIITNTNNTTVIDNDIYVIPHSLIRP